MPAATMAMPTEIPGVEPRARTGAQASRDLYERLSAAGAGRDEAVAELHALLLKATRFELNRRGDSLPHLGGGDREDLAQQSADDALLAVLRKLGEFRGE